MFDNVGYTFLCVNIIRYFCVFCHIVLLLSVLYVSFFLFIFMVNKTSVLS